MRLTSSNSRVPLEEDAYHHDIYDLVWMLFAGVLLLGILLLAELIPAVAHYLIPLRIPLGVLYILFAPGYLLQSALLPHSSDLNLLERLGLSLGLSMTLVPLVALLLDWLPWGLRYWPIVIGQTILVLFLFIVAVVQRLFLPSTEIVFPLPHLKLSEWWSHLEPFNRRLMIFVAIALLFAGLAAAWIFLVPSPDDYITEFYMLDPQGLAENFPGEGAVGQPLNITLGLTSHERSLMHYRIEIWQVDPLDETHRQLVGAQQSINLQVGESRQLNQSWQPAWDGQDQKFEFLLFTIDSSEPYRQLLLWININP